MFMQQEIMIKPVIIEDIPEIARMEIDSFPGPWTENMLKESLSGNHIFLGAFGGGQLYGYIIITKLLDEISIDNLCVKKECRNRGTGKLLISYVLDLAGTNKTRKLFLEVLSTNIPAIRLYESFNFRKYGLRKKYYPDNGDAVLMKLDLTY